MEIFQRFNKEEEKQENLITEIIKLDNGQKMVNKYIKGRFIGEDENARYYQTKEVGGTVIQCLKIINKQDLNKNPKKKQRLLIQVSNHKKLTKVINIVKFFKVFQDPQNIYILLQYCVNGSLEDLLRRRIRISDKEMQYYFSELVNILKALKQFKIIHRNIKPENLYLDKDMRLKLGDFSESAEYTAEKRKSMIKPNLFSAPEIFNNSGHSYETDMWSIGVVIYTLLSGRSPFKPSEDFMYPERKIKNGCYQFDEELMIHWRWQEIIKKILIVDPEKRATIQQLTALQFQNRPHYLPKSLLFVANRLCPEPFLAWKAKKPDFKTLLNANFSEQQQSQPSYYRTQKSSLAPSIASSELKMTDKQIILQSRKVIIPNITTWSVKEEIGIVYAVDNYLGINFLDKTILIGGETNYEYYDQEGKRMEIRNQRQTQLDAELKQKIKTVKQYRLKFNLKPPTQWNCPVYVKKVRKSSKYLIFKLSNGAYQICFPDNSYVILISERMTYFGSSPNPEIYLQEAGMIMQKLQKRKK